MAFRVCEPGSGHAATARICRAMQETGLLVDYLQGRWYCAGTLSVDSYAWYLAKRAEQKTCLAFLALERCG